MFSESVFSGPWRKEDSRGNRTCARTARANNNKTCWWEELFFTSDGDSQGWEDSKDLEEASDELSSSVPKAAAEDQKAKPLFFILTVYGELFFCAPLIRLNSHRSMSSTFITAPVNHLSSASTLLIRTVHVRYPLTENPPTSTSAVLFNSRSWRTTSQSSLLAFSSSSRWLSRGSDNPSEAEARVAERWNKSFF